jgi:hypothetical protein
MNKRTIQLITEADAYAWTIAEKYVTRDCCHDGEVNYLWEDAFRKKFAELIVNECAKIAGKAEYSDTWLEPVEDAIKKHFGVE